MKNRDTPYRVGNTTVTKVAEQTLRNVSPAFLYPTSTEREFEAVGARLDPCDCEPNGKELVLSIHTWVVRTPRHLILVDTGSGNNKERPKNPIFHHQDLPYLERLQQAGVRPEDVDFVINTHLHVDHSGWNTVLRDGQWLPTFPKARYLFATVERDYYSTPASHNDANTPNLGVYEDSVLPVIEAGLVDFIGPEGGEYMPGLSFMPTPGHSIGHMSICVRSDDEEAIFAGDVMHHPTQVQRPDWNTVFCEFSDGAVASRRDVLESAAETNALYFATHFPGSSVGRISRSADAFNWNYA
ncbi:MBL fold metallo-hydrolase [Mesorhizobium sp.]|uniref:MBL fold metallo-hydrolase n=1 Tax=Mesorhizobium sp. TaxID=1871066 RepID=UPI000FE6671E|nr:MBL fold metallo-hydrolase [Mesorhizobium sp.]RWP99106.1 MAG: MBL fold metallo-hydrolase [Mesorhizobium sp.]